MYTHDMYILRGVESVGTHLVVQISVMDMYMHNYTYLFTCTCTRMYSTWLMCMRIPTIWISNCWILSWTTHVHVHVYMHMHVLTFLNANASHIYMYMHIFLSIELRTCTCVVYVHVFSMCHCVLWDQITLEDQFFELATPHTMCVHPFIIVHTCTLQYPVALEVSDMYIHRSYPKGSYMPVSSMQRTIASMGTYTPGNKFSHAWGYLVTSNKCICKHWLSYQLCQLQNHPHPLPG